MSVVLKAEGISKQYRLGQLGTGTISHDLNRFFAKIRGKEDPYLQVGDQNDRSKAGGSEYVWSLNDVSFDVQQGEVLGIIGKNGAGKSTLLKILSQVTTPTKGNVKVKGRIAALLEVGTGFHPDLTGRENIFLNGAILGMTKTEIKNKLEEIVEFSGVIKYIDTPVKRYSSGMLVRLGFAIAAHLEPEILIVDEVLAVGDAEFQQKCLGKMKDVSGQGRTVLFVSHDMSAIRSLCHNAIFLKNGRINSQGPVEEIVRQYLNEGLKAGEAGAIPDGASVFNTGELKFTAIRLLNEESQIINALFYSQPFSIELELEVFVESTTVILDLAIGTIEKRILYSSSFDLPQQAVTLNMGKHKVSMKFPNKFLPGTYTFYLGAHQYDGQVKTIDYLERISDFNVLKVSADKSKKYPFDVFFGNINETTTWHIEKIIK